MLTGDENMVKPDSKILWFMRRVIGNQASMEILKRTHPMLRLRKLDHEIWKYEMVKKSQSSRRCNRLADFVSHTYHTLLFGEVYCFAHPGSNTPMWNIMHIERNLRTAHLRAFMKTFPEDLTAVLERG